MSCWSSIRSTAFRWDTLLASECPLVRIACSLSCKLVLTKTGDNHEWLEKVLLEVQLLQRLAHQNLVSYRHVWLENVQISSPSIITRFVPQAG